MSVSKNAAVVSHQEQLDQLLSEVQALREQLRRSQRLATMGTLTAMVAHEFNNILTPIINYAQMARGNPKLADKAIAKAADGGARATSICKALLRLTHESQIQTEVNLSELIADTLEAMARDVKKDGIELSVNVPSDLTLSTRRVELQQVLLNLLINARWAVLEQGGIKRIEIAATRQNNLLTLEVSDTGVGISPENLEKIFQPFFSTKSDPCDEDKCGHGLGLAICHDILTSLGGSISVQSAPTQGAKFTIRLPI